MQHGHAGMDSLFPSGPSPPSGPCRWPSFPSVACYRPFAWASSLNGWAGKEEHALMQLFPLKVGVRESVKMCATKCNLFTPKAHPAKQSRVIFIYFLIIHFLKHECTRKVVHCHWQTSFFWLFLNSYLFRSG